MPAMNITIWNEFRHEQSKAEVAEIYPDGIHAALAEGLSPILPDATIETATLDEPQHGLTQERLDNTDVMWWWGHAAHDEVDDGVVSAVQQRVWEGMGLIPLHSAHASKIFQRLMGTGCMLRWREAGEMERLWVVDPSHPIVDGLGTECITLPETEMYGEFFDIPQPDSVVFISWFAGGEVFRSGCTFSRGKGKIFYFRPGHETHPIYHNDQILRVIANACRWAAPNDAPYTKEARAM